jgi:hypothetical protein
LQETQVNVYWNHHCQRSSKNVNVGNIVCGNELFLETNDLLCLLVVSVSETGRIEFDDVLLEVKNLLITTIEVGTKLLGFHKKTLLDHIIRNLQVVLSHAKKAFLTGDFVHLSERVEPFQVREDLSEGTRPTRCVLQLSSGSLTRSEEAIQVDILL